MFSAWTLIGLGLSFLKAALAAAKVGGLPQEIIDDIQAGIDKIETVHGTPVTKDQLDALMVDGPFGGQ